MSASWRPTGHAFPVKYSRAECVSTNGLGSGRNPRPFGEEEGILVALHVKVVEGCGQVGVDRYEVQPWQRE